MAKMVLLGDLISPAPLLRCGNGSFPVLSMTMHDGIMLQSDRFKKNLASLDQSNYKVVKRGQLVVGFPIDEGVLYVQSISDAGIMSPAYSVWNIDVDKTFPRFLELSLHSPMAMQYYKDNLRGTTARRRSIPTEVLLSFPLILPPIEEQRRITSVLDKLSNLISLRKQQLAKLDELVKARFVEMFGDITNNPKQWEKEPLENHVDILTGFPFDSTGFVSNGIKICGGLIIMPDKINWEDCKWWPNAVGYENYLLADTDIVMALDRPWISDGFKIALVSKGDLPSLLIQRTARIRAKDMNQLFIYSLLQDEAFSAHCNVTGSLVPHISHKDIKSYPVVVPPIVIQDEFAEFARNVRNQKLTIQQSLDKLEVLKKSLMQEYFR